MNLKQKFILIRRAFLRKIIFKALLAEKKLIRAYNQSKHKKLK